MIIYEPLWKTMADKKISKYKLIHKHGIARNTLKRMQQGGFHITTRTIDDLCKILDCEIGDIVKYVKDEPKED